MAVRFPALIVTSLFAVLVCNEAQSDVSNSKNSWRCGIFFATNDGAAPRAKVFVMPKRFPADCDRPNIGAYNSTCHELMKKGLKDWNYESPSRFRASSGFTIGDDLCSPIPRDIPSPGLELGFYFGYCGSDWLDTGLRKPERLCCSRRKRVLCR